MCSYNIALLILFSLPQFGPEAGLALKNHNSLEVCGMENEISILEENSIRSKIHVIRGQQVMLDFDLAEIYGYSTKAFNQQVKNNIERFDDDFRFQLSEEEVKELSRSKILTLKNGRGSNIKYAPHAFTEQGIYMLMTVLKGDLAVKQSKALIRAFQAMKNYIIENRSMIGQHEYLQLSLHVNENKTETTKLRKDLTALGIQMTEVMDKLSNVVERSEISPFLLDMGNPSEKREYLFLDGQPMKADLAYMEIYGKATKNIHIIDDYINHKTLHLLSSIEHGIDITIISDNIGRNLHLSDYQDFQKEKPGFEVRFVRNNRISHDRFIVIDYGTEQEKLFICGSSSKDSGNRMTTIMQFADPDIIFVFDKKLAIMLENPPLELR